MFVPGPCIFTINKYCSRELSSAHYTLNSGVREDKRARPSVSKKQQQNTKKIYKMKYSAEELLQTLSVKLQGMKEKAIRRHVLNDANYTDEYVN